MSDERLLLMGSLAGLLILGLLVGIGIKLWRRKRFPSSPHDALWADTKEKGQGGNFGTHAVERITSMFPALQRQPTKTEEKSAESVPRLQGNLTQTPLPDLLQFLALGGKSGMVEITCGRRTGRVVMHKGKVVKNFYRGKEDLEAMYSMLDLTEGDFEFFSATLENADVLEGFEVVDIIMLWMEKKPRKKNTTK